MPDELKPIEEAEFDDALAMVPEEVQDFMWGDAFEFLLDVAQQAIPLNDVEKESMRTAAYRILLNLRTMEQEAKRLLTEKIEPGKVTKIFYVIETEILSRAQTIVQNEQDADARIASIAPASESNNRPIAPNQSDVLARLSQSFTTPTTLAPTKRIYSDVPNNSSATTTTKPAVDPYRIDPNEK